MPHGADQPTLEQRWDLLAERRLKPYCVWEDAGEEAWGCLSKIQVSKEHRAGCEESGEGTDVQQDLVLV